MVGDVDAGSPAAQAGVRSGDVLLQVDRNSVKSPEELRAVFQSIAPGTTVKLGVERQRRSLDLPVRLGATSRPYQFSAQRTTLGVRLGELRQGEGAVVQTVMNNSPADQAGVKPGDVIAKLDGETVFNSGHVREILDSKQPGGSVKLVLLRNGEERELEARLSAGTNQTATTLR